MAKSSIFTEGFITVQKQNGEFVSVSATWFERGKKNIIALARQQREGIRPRRSWLGSGNLVILHRGEGENKEFALVPEEHIGEVFYGRTLFSYEYYVAPHSVGNGVMEDTEGVLTAPFSTFEYGEEVEL